MTVEAIQKAIFRQAQDEKQKQIKIDDNLKLLLKRSFRLLTSQRHNQINIGIFLLAHLF